MNYLKQCKEQALENSKRFYKDDFYISSEADIFLNEINFLFKTPQDLCYKKDGVKIVVNYKNNKFIIDYDYGNEDSIFVFFKREDRINEAFETTLKDLKKCIKKNISLC